MRKWSSRSILAIMSSDIKRMTEDDTSSPIIMNYIKRRTKFLEHPPDGNKINWD